MTSVLFGLLKGLLVLALGAAALNELRVTAGTLVRVCRRRELAPSAIRKAGWLWTGAAVSAWAFAGLISAAEAAGLEGRTGYAFALLHADGLLLLAAALAAGVAAVAAAMSRAEDGLRCGGILREAVRRDCVLAVLIWVSAWAVS